MVAPKRILVVDDERTVRESCERILGERRCEVDTAASGAEGLARRYWGFGGSKPLPSATTSTHSPPWA